MNIETKLHVEIDNEFEALASMEVGSEAYRTTVEGITKLMDRAIEIEKLETEERERIQIREKEDELKRKQMIEEKRDRVVKNCLTGAGILIPTIVTIWGTIKSMEFEKTGTITTIMGRGFIQKMLPRK